MEQRSQPIPEKAEQEVVEEHTVETVAAPSHTSPSAFEYQESRIEKYLTPLAIILGSLIIAGSIFYTQAYNLNAVGNTIPGTTNTQATTTAVSIKDVSTAGDPFIGNANAPVTIAYWTDYQCPFCKQIETEALPSVITNYVNNGKVKIVFKDFQFLGQDSTIAAIAARSIWNLYPSQYFTWREAMYKAQDQENSGFGDEASIVALTKKIPGIDANAVVKDINAHQDSYQQAITDDKNQGEQLGIQGTPALIIGNQLIPGALSYSDLKTIIDKQLQ